MRSPEAVDSPRKPREQRFFVVLGRHQRISVTASRTCSAKQPAGTLVNGGYPLIGEQLRLPTGDGQAASEVGGHVVALKSSHGRSVSAAAYRIFAHALAEMLNNAIEHSRSPTCTVEVTVSELELRAHQRDQGVGVFASVAERHHLAEEVAAIGELLKGKATSIPERQAGEGVFFTSKACDRLALGSHRSHRGTPVQFRDAVGHPQGARRCGLSLLDRPNVQIVRPTERHWFVLKDLFSDFSRFPKQKWVDPLKG